MIIEALTLHFLLICMILIFGNRDFNNKVIKVLRVFFYMFYFLLWNNASSFVPYPLISLNITDLVILKFISFLLLVSSIFNWNKKLFSVKMEILYFVVVIFFMAKGVVLFYLSSIFIIIFFLLWLIESEHRVTAKDIYPFVILILLNILLLFISFRFSDKLYVEQGGLSASLIVTFLLSVFLMFFIYIIDKIYTLSRGERDNSEHVIITFVLVIIPYLFKFAIVYIHYLNTLLQINSYIYEISGVILLLFSTLLLIKSLYIKNRKNYIFTLYLLHFVNFLGVGIYLYGQRFSLIYMELFLYISLLQYAYLMVEDNFERMSNSISHVFLLFLFLFLAPSPMFTLSINYIELLYKFSSKSAIICSMLSLLLIFIMIIKLLRGNLDIKPHYFSKLALQSYFLGTVIVGYILFLK